MYLACVTVDITPGFFWLWVPEQTESQRKIEGKIIKCTRSDLIQQSDQYCHRNNTTEQEHNILTHSLVYIRKVVCRNSSVNFWLMLHIIPSLRYMCNTFLITVYGYCPWPIVLETSEPLFAQYVHTKGIASRFLFDHFTDDPESLLQSFYTKKQNNLSWLFYVSVIDPN